MLSRSDDRPGGLNANLVQTYTWSFEVGPLKLILLLSEFFAPVRRVMCGGFNTNMRVTKSFLSFVLMVGVLINALPLAAQNGKRAPAPTPGLRASLETSEPSEVFRQFRKSGQNVAFSPMLKKVAGAEAEDIEAALEAQAVNFYESLAAASKTEFAKLRDKAKALNQKTYEEMKKNPPQSKREPKKLPRAVGKSFSAEDLFPLETGGPRAAQNFAPLPDEVPIGKTETETGITVRGAETKTMDMADSTVTRIADAIQKGGTDGKEIFTETSQTETTTVVSKTDNSKVEKVEKLGWGAGFAMCSDAAGHLSGHAKMSISSKVTTTKGNRIAAVTHVLSVVYKITGYVNDDAEFTHFKMEVEGTETLTGTDRARDLGLMDDTRMSDGTGTIKYHADNCKPPYETEPDQYGNTSVVLPKIGNTVADSYNPLPGSEKLIGLIPSANDMALVELQDLMRSTAAQLRNGSCVEVECLAAKNTLKPGETIDVTAVSVSKRDLDKFNARLEDDKQCDPKKQLGTPSTVFVFTADAGGGGTFLVKSTSRRGIALGMLEFGKEGKNDLDKDKCDGNWHGTIRDPPDIRRGAKRGHQPRRSKVGPSVKRLERDHQPAEIRWHRADRGRSAGHARHLGAERRVRHGRQLVLPGPRIFYHSQRMRLVCEKDHQGKQRDGKEGGRRRKRRYRCDGPDPGRRVPGLYRHSGNERRLY